MDHGKKILIINPGSTSTKIGVFFDGELRVNVSVKHDDAELRKFPTIWDQYDFRREAIFQVLQKNQLSMGEMDAIACRGGNVKPLPGGIYRVCARMIADMKSGAYGGHPINVGGLVAYDLGNQFNIPVLTADPPMTDELCPSARYSGIPQITRCSSFHALNQKATARKIAAALGKKYHEVNLIVTHLGGGISVGAHRRGKIIDVNNALDGDGPFSPERAGSLPAGDLVKLCFSGDFSQSEVLKLLTGNGGLFAYLGTTNVLEVEKRIEADDQKAAEVFEAMIYQVEGDRGLRGGAGGEGGCHRADREPGLLPAAFGEPEGEDFLHRPRVPEPGRERDGSAGGCGAALLQQRGGIVGLRRRGGGRCRKGRNQPGMTAKTA